MYEEIAGTKVRLQVDGHGSPTIIFVHGWGGCRHDWDEQVRKLSPTYRTISLDLPGHGDSERPKEATLERLAGAVAAIVNRCGKEGAVLVGHSVGCRVVVRAYADCDAWIRGVVLTDGSLFVEGDPEPTVQIFLKNIAAMGMHTFVERGFGAMFVPGTDPALRERLTRQAHKMDESFGVGIWIDSLRWEGHAFSEALSKLKVPVLMVQSTTAREDGLGRRSLEPGMTTPWTEFVRQRIPDAQLLIIPGVGHFPHCEAPKAFADGVGNFLATLTKNVGPASEPK